MKEVQYRRANQDDLPAIAEVFLTAFPESVQHYVGRLVEPRVVEDVFAICLDAEPQAFIVAEIGGKMAGYIFAPARFPRLLRVAFLHGHLLRMFWRWITGKYQIGIKPVFVALQNWLYLWQDAWSAALRADARILSVAVAPKFQGYGIGSKLVELGLDYLERAGPRTVRLEVRPDNPAARHIYEKAGFRTKGRTRDTQGEWLVMLKDLSKPAAA